MILLCLSLLFLDRILVSFPHIIMLCSHILLCFAIVCHLFAFLLGDFLLLNLFLYFHHSMLTDTIRLNFLQIENKKKIFVHFLLLMVIL